MKASTARREKRITRPKKVIRARIMSVILVRDICLGGVGGDAMVSFSFECGVDVNRCVVLSVTVDNFHNER